MKWWWGLQVCCAVCRFFFSGWWRKSSPLSCFHRNPAGLEPTYYLHMCCGRISSWYSSCILYLYSPVWCVIIFPPCCLPHKRLRLISSTCHCFRFAFLFIMDLGCRASNSGKIKKKWLCSCCIAVWPWPETPHSVSRLTCLQARLVPFKRTTLFGRENRGGKPS